MTPQRLHADSQVRCKVSKAYLLGALHDGCKRKHTYRITQKYKEYINGIAELLKSIGYNAWTYQEGNRDVFVVEFSKTVLSGFEITSIQDKVEYIRGYFDAEGSVPLKEGARMYIYFCQKDLIDLEEVKTFLQELGINCGITHNPSSKKDPDYWRFFVSSKSYSDFAQKIGSMHPIKQRILEKMI